MRRTMLKSKIHRATLTECFLEYEGSVAIDANLLKAADILPGELVHVLNVNNGKRLVTYEESELEQYRAKIVKVDAQNRVKE